MGDQIETAITARHTNNPVIRRKRKPMDRYRT